MDDWWTTRLLNPQVFSGLYETEPRLTDFELSALSLEDRGPTCFIRGFLADFPDNPRPTWDLEAHRLLLRFSLSAVERFRARGQSAGGAVDLVIERAGDGFGTVVRGSGSSFEFEVEGIGLQILGMTPIVEKTGHDSSRDSSSQ